MDPNDRDLGPEDEEEQLDEGLDEGQEAGEEGEDGDGGSDGHEELEPPSQARQTGGDSSAQEPGSARQTQAQVGGRADRRIATLREEARQARELAARTARELDELRAAQARAAAQPDPRVEAERLAAMTPQEQFQYFLQQERQERQRELNQLRYENAENADRAAFANLTAVNPVARRLAPKVEEYLANERRQGRNYQREVVLKYLAGEEALARSNPTRDRQARDAQNRLARQKVRPGGGSSDVQGGRRNREQTLEERLADVVF